MLGLDTNVLIRVLVGHDDPEQSRRARALLTSRCTPDNPAYINAIVLCEAAWVLAGPFGYGRASVLEFLDKVLNQRAIVVEDQEIARRALDLCKSSALDFADVYLGLRNQRGGCETTATFDRRAARLPMFEPV